MERFSTKDNYAIKKVRKIMDQCCVLCFFQVVENGAMELDKGTKS